MRCRVTLRKPDLRDLRRQELENISMAAEETLRCREIIDGLAGLQDISRNFYYDETNNYRKFHFKSGRLNIEDAGEFLLGGIVVDQGRSIDISQLKNEIRLDKSANELKFKHVAKGGLSDILKSRKIRTILEFLKSEYIDIHFQRVDSFYWGIVDIVESIDLPRDLILLHLDIKDCLYCALASDIEKVVSMLYVYNYPDIDTSKIRRFYEEISSIVRAAHDGNGYIREALLYVLEIGSNQGEAVFIQAEERSVLVDDYSGFYRDRILTFPASNHFIDTEEEVKTSLDQIGNSFKGIALSNYRFVHSHESDGIQLSDVVIGLVSKIVNFCNQRTESELISFRRNLGSSECRILDLVEELITRSDNRCRAYFHNVIPLSHMGIYGSLFQKLR